MKGGSVPTFRHHPLVIPAQAGIQQRAVLPAKDILRTADAVHWIPVFTGMTLWVWQTLNPSPPTKLIDVPQTPFILIPPFHNTGAGATNVRGEGGPGSLGVASGKVKTVPRPACPRWQVYRGNPAGMDPSASKSTGHAKNPGCMRRCMSHLFITQTGHAPSHAASSSTPWVFGPGGGFGVGGI